MTKSGISLITGPMWGGKTSELYKKLNMHQAILDVNNIILIRFSGSENRVESERIIPSLDNRIKIIYLTDLSIENIESIDINIKEIKVIGIDEAQFFNALRNFCLLMADEFSKTIIVSGLNGDFNRNTFGEISSLLPICDEIILKHSLCSECRDGTPGIFSLKLNCDCENNQVEIGGTDIYKTVCRKHYYTLNKKD
tara:strand:- start:1245 stop:1832 length:588 start_codon:yes stop_codon:yes gene_type:complete